MSVYTSPRLPSQNSSPLAPLLPFGESVGSSSQSLRTGWSGGGIQRNTTNRKPSQYDGFGGSGTAGLPNNRKAGEPEYVHPDSVTELVDYSRMESAQSNC